MNHLIFPEIALVATPEPTPEPAPVPTPKPTPEPAPEKSEPAYRSVSDPEPDGSSEWMSVDEALEQWYRDCDYPIGGYDFSDDGRYITIWWADSDGEFYRTIDRAAGEYVLS